MCSWSVFGLTLLECGDSSPLFWLVWLPVAQAARLCLLCPRWRVALRQSQKAKAAKESPHSKRVKPENAAAAGCRERMIHATRSVAYGCSRQGLTRFATSL